jgi:hypothetical protein
MRTELLLVIGGIALAVGLAPASEDASVQAADGLGPGSPCHPYCFSTAVPLGLVPAVWKLQAVEPMP